MGELLMNILHEICTTHCDTCKWITDMDTISGWYGIIFLCFVKFSFLEFSDHTWTAVSCFIYPPLWIQAHAHYVKNMWVFKDLQFRRLFFFFFFFLNHCFSDINCHLSVDDRPKRQENVTVVTVLLRFTTIPFTSHYDVMYTSYDPNPMQKC